VIYLTLPSR